MQEKFKSWLADDALFTGVLLILVGIASFGLGRWSVAANSVPVQAAGVILSNVPKPVVPEPESGPSTISPTFPEVRAQAVVASKSGAKYHLPTCPGAVQIKDSNKITFSTIAEAEAAGYTPAANCPGLKK